MQKTLAHTKIGDIFWDQIGVDITSPDHRFRIRAKLIPMDQIELSCQKDRSPELEEDVRRLRQSQFGRLAVHGQLIEYEGANPSRSLTNLNWQPLAEAAEHSVCAAETLKFLQNSKFFQKYGGDSTWEYAAAK